MPDGLYERDALAWSDREADLLRRIAAGERLNEAVDWANVIEEVQDVGLSELRACQSLLQQTLTHLLKLHAWPSSQSVGYWRDEVSVFLDDAERRFTPSMRQRIELDMLYAKSLRRVREKTDAAGLPNQLPDACPYSLDDLLFRDLDAPALVARLGDGLTAPP